MKSKDTKSAQPSESNPETTVCKKRNCHVNHIPKALEELAEECGLGLRPEQPPPSSSPPSPS